MSSNLLTRVTKLEAENVSLQEEILTLKKQLTNASLSPKDTRDESALEETVAELRVQVQQAVSELSKYRI
jgi:hypothetical protein